MNLSVAIMQVTVFFAFMQLEAYAALVQVTVFGTNMWVTNFIVIIKVGVSVTIMQVVLSAVHHAHDCFCCNYTGDCLTAECRES